MGGFNEMALLRAGFQAAVDERDRLKVEVQRQTELRRLEWNRAEQLQYQVNELRKEIERLEGRAQE